MTVLCGLCVQALLLVALISGTCIAGFFEKDRKLRVQTANKAAVDASYGAAATCTPGTPQFPNYIQPVKVDPARMMGKWYLYMAWFDGIADTRVSVNIVITNTNLLNGSLTLYPGSNTPAIAFEQIHAPYSVIQNRCDTVRASYLLYLTVDGQVRGLGFSGTTGAIETSLLLSTDYETYALFFQCDKYDVNSGICADPYTYVYSRDRPDKVAATTANNIVSAINQALGSYCFSANVMKTYPWINDMLECPLVAVTNDCYVSLRNAYVSLGDPNVSG